MSSPTPIHLADLLENEHQLNVFCSLEKFIDDLEREHDVPLQDFLRASMVQVMLHAIMTGETPIVVEAYDDVWTKVDGYYAREGFTFE